MAEAPDRLTIPDWVNRITQYKSFFVPVAFVSLLAVIVVPLHPVMMDLLISANLALAAVILLTTLFVQRPLDFSVFPSLLLGTTLVRLVLNIASTRLILTADADSPESHDAALTLTQSSASNCYVDEASCDQLVYGPLEL